MYLAIDVLRSWDVHKLKLLVTHVQLRQRLVTLRRFNPVVLRRIAQHPQQKSFPLGSSKLLE